MTKPRISLTMIVRNEAHNLPACLSSCAGLFDEIVVLDTGSSDDTREIAGSFGAVVRDFVWCDSFSAARNECLRHASSDWVFWLDADDRLAVECIEPVRHLLDYLGEPCAYRATIDLKYPGGVVSSVEQCRLFHRGLGLFWIRRVHEHLYPLHAGIKRPSPIRISHGGYASPDLLARKSRRNIPLLEMELADRPGDASVYYYLGVDWIDLRNFAMALRFLERCREILYSAGERPVYHDQLLFNLGLCYGMTSWTAPLWHRGRP